MTTPSKQKIYCYVDETGQDTLGRMFIVAVVATGAERDELLQEALRIEESSKKRSKKWHRAEFRFKCDYIRAILLSPLFAKTLFFAEYHDTKAYLDLMALATAQAINSKAQAPYKTTVIVDALGVTELARFTRVLRQLRISVRKIRGMKDESDALLRLADALAGFVRDYREGQTYATDLYQSVGAEKIITRLGQ